MWSPLDRYDDKTKEDFDVGELLKYALRYDSLVTSPRMTPHVKGGEKDEFDNCGTDFHYMFGQVDTWESVTNSDWLMYDTSGASVMGSSAVKLQTHKNYPFTRATHETDWTATDGQSTYKGVGSG